MFASTTIRGTRGALRVVKAWIVLHWMSVSLVVFGFDRTLRLATRRSLRQRCPARETCDQLTEMVACAIGIAKRWHARLTPNDCLPVALAGVCLMRRAGLDAALALGVTRYPFSAHAWVVVGDRAVDYPPRKFQAFSAVTIPVRTRI